MPGSSHIKNNTEGGKGGLRFWLHAALCGKFYWERVGEENPKSFGFKVDWKPFGQEILFKKEMSLTWCGGIVGKPGAQECRGTHVPTQGHLFSHSSSWNGEIKEIASLGRGALCSLKMLTLMKGRSPVNRHITSLSQLRWRRSGAHCLSHFSGCGNIKSCKTVVSKTIPGNHS